MQREQWGLTDPRPPFEHFDLEPWAQPAGASSVLPVRVAHPHSGLVDDSEGAPVRTETAA